MTGVQLGVLKRRTLPFFQVGEAEMALIAESCPSRHLAYARSVYVELVRSAHNARSPVFELGRSDLAKAAGVSPKTLDRILPALADAGVVQADGGPTDGCPKRWILLGVQEGGWDSQTRGVGPVDQGGGTLRPTLASRLEEGEEKDMDSGERGGADQTTLDVPESRVDAFLDWYSKELSQRGFTPPAVTHAKSRQPARWLLARATGVELKGMFEFAINRTFWASKIVQLGGWKKDFVRLRAEWLAYQGGNGRRSRDEDQPERKPMKSTCYMHDRLVTYDGGTCPVCAAGEE